ETAELKRALAAETWDVLHSINLGRLVDQYPCYVARKAHPRLKWAISTVWVDYRAYDRQRIWGLRFLPTSWIEWGKLLGRALLSGDRWPAWSLLFTRNVFQKIAWSADVLVASTKVEATRIRHATGLGASVRTIPLGRDHIAEVPPAAHRQGWVVLGRVEGLKNQVAAVDAWIQLKGRGFNEALTLYGDTAPNHGRYARQLKSAVERAQALGVNVEWKPALPATEVPKLLATCRGVLVPSLFETFGLTALEGLHAGCEVVLSSAAESASLLAPYVRRTSPNASAIAEAILAPSSVEPLPADAFTWASAATQLLSSYAEAGHFIAFTGSRGMPNRYGGYEEMVDHVGRRLADRGHRVWISTSSAHPDRDYHYPGIQRAHHYDPESWMGSAGQFVYDWISLRRLKPWKPDAHIALGTTSSGPWLRWSFWRGESPLAVHMDGLEWMRGKYSPAIRRYLRKAEALAAYSAQFLVSDNPGISAHLQTYQRPIEEIAYGVEIPQALEKEELANILSDASLTPGNYALILCRLVPENNVAVALEALLDKGPVAVLGDWSNAYAQNLLHLFGGHPNFVQLNANFDPRYTQALRQGSRLYVHGHSAGGTNPGLLQAMAAGCRIAAHDNVFNQAVLGPQAMYFQDATQLQRAWENAENIPTQVENTANYTWDGVTEAYASLAAKLRTS
ncbi:MAG: hypothetical protein RL168_84, partial [Bacteroidota bacterium]